MRRGKVSVCLSVVVVITKIARFRHLGISATRKYNESVEFVENWPQNA